MKRFPFICYALCAVLLCTAHAARAEFDCGDETCGKRIQVISAVMELLRGLEFRQPVSLEPQSPQQAREKILALREREGMTIASLSALQQVYGVMGLVDAGFDLNATYAEVNSQHARSMYDAAGGKVYITEPGKTPGWESPMVRKAMEALGLSEIEFLIARELAHALPAQSFDSGALFDAGGRNSDQALAARSLANGDAVMLLVDFLLRHTGANSLALKNPGLAIAQFAPSVNLVNRPTLAGLPEAVRGRITFPYVQGYDFVLALRQSGGWPLVNAAYQSPPMSTEQVLHPEKYLEQRDVPVEIHLPPMEDALGGSAVKVFDDVFGELGLRVFLEHWLNSDAEAETAAAGWGGDHVVLYHLGDKAGALLILYTTWDSTEDAIEFSSSAERAFAALSASRGGAVNIQRLARDVIVLYGNSANALNTVATTLLRTTKQPVIAPPPMVESLDPDSAFFDEQIFYSMLSQVPPRKPDLSKNWRISGKTYEHKQYKYRIKAPNDNWVFQPFTLGSQVITEFTAFHKGYVGSEITLESFDRPAPGEIDPLDDMILFVNQQMGSFEVVSERETKIAGLPAREVTLKGVLILPITARYTELLGKDQVFVFTAATASYLFEKLVPEFDAFIESFELLN
jgi:hypothetical protein